MNKEIVLTEDGSHTIYIPEMDEHYHSTHGAIQESIHIYINNGLLSFSNKEITVLEIGFGTGLNAFLTAIFCKNHNISARYFSIEKYPLIEKEYNLLNYSSGEFQDNSDLLYSIQHAKWDVDVEISSNFSLRKIYADLESYQFTNLPTFDLVYYDAFAPNKQPELWTDEIITKVSDHVHQNGIVVTYCAKGSVRRTFASSGFEMKRLPGPPGKKEILRGKKL